MCRTSVLSRIRCYRLTLTTPPLRVTTFTPAFPTARRYCTDGTHLLRKTCLLYRLLYGQALPGRVGYRLRYREHPPSPRAIGKRKCATNDAGAHERARGIFSTRHNRVSLASSARIFWRVRAENTRAQAINEQRLYNSCGRCTLTVDRLDFGEYLVAIRQHDFDHTKHQHNAQN